MSNVIILRGVSGSGKSTLANTFNLPIVSADDHLMVDGQYRFNPALLGEAHAACLRRFTELVQSGMGVVVDNTNTTIAELAPYAALALAYGHSLRIVTVECDPDVAAARNTHGVPAGAVHAMHKRLAESAAQIPPWWPQETHRA